MASSPSIGVRPTRRQNSPIPSESKAFDLSEYVAGGLRIASSIKLERAVTLSERPFYDLAITLIAEAA
jgi:hypothetical protein